jgi:hypothetical protein
MPQTTLPNRAFPADAAGWGRLNTGLAAAGGPGAGGHVQLPGRRPFLRFQLSRDAAFKLSSQTKAVLDSLTNDVQMTIFFQPDGDNEEIYGLTSALLAEYQNANPRHVHVTPAGLHPLPGPAKELLSKCDLNGPRRRISSSSRATAIKRLFMPGNWPITISAN